MALKLILFGFHLYNVIIIVEPMLSIRALPHVSSATRVGTFKSTVLGKGTVGGGGI